MNQERGDDDDTTTTTIPLLSIAAIEFGRLNCSPFSFSQ